MSGAQHEGRNRGQLREAGGCIVAAQRAELLHHDRRLIGEIAAKEQRQRHGEGVGIIGGGAGGGRQHEVEERAPAHPAGADPRANAGDENRPGERRRVGAAGERAQEREAPDAGRRRSAISCAMTPPIECPPR